MGFESGDKPPGLSNGVGIGAEIKMRPDKAAKNMFGVPGNSIGLGTSGSSGTTANVRPEAVTTGSNEAQGGRRNWLSTQLSGGEKGMRAAMRRTGKSRQTLQAAATDPSILNEIASQMS